MSAESRAVAASSDQYDVDEAIPVEGLAAAPSGCNLLIAGPSMLGVERIAMDVICTGLRLGEHGIVVSPDQPAEHFISEYSETIDQTAGTFRIVDCSAVGGSGSADEHDEVSAVTAPGNLTDIGVGLTNSTQAIGDSATAGVRVALLSLSTLIQYTDLDRVFKFVHVATSRFSAAEYLSVATIDSGIHDEQTINKIKAQFDGIVQLRETEGGEAEIRTVGFPEVDSGWSPM